MEGEEESNNPSRPLTTLPPLPERKKRSLRQPEGRERPPSQHEGGSTPQSQHEIDLLGDTPSEDDSRLIAQALVSLENMIEGVRKEKQYIDRQFDDLYEQKLGNTAKIEKPSRLKNPLELIAQDVIDLVQRRNELILQGSGGLAQTVDMKQMLMNQIMNMGNEGTNKSLSMVNKPRTQATREGGIASMLKRGEGGFDTQKNSQGVLEDPNLTPDYGAEYGSGREEIHPVKDSTDTKSKYDRFYQRMMHDLERKKRKEYQLAESKEMEEEEQLDNLFHPEISKKSKELARASRQKKKGGDRPIHERIAAILTDRQSHLQQLRHQHEQDSHSPSRSQSEYSFSPSISPSRLYHPVELSPKKSKMPTDLTYPCPSPLFPAASPLQEKMRVEGVRRRVRRRLLVDRVEREQKVRYRDVPAISPLSSRIASRHNGYVNRVEDRLHADARDRIERRERLMKKIGKEIYPFSPVVREYRSKNMISEESRVDMGREGKRDSTGPIRIDGYWEEGNKENVGRHGNMIDLGRRLFQADQSAHKLRSTSPLKSILIPRESMHHLPSSPYKPGRASPGKVYVHDRRVTAMNPPTRSYMREDTMHMRVDRRVYREIIDYITR